jgi:hypothetical protein
MMNDIACIVCNVHISPITKPKALVKIPRVQETEKESSSKRRANLEKRQATMANNIPG